MARHKSTVEAASEYLGKEIPFSIGEIGHGDVEVIDRPYSMSKLETEQFMNEPVTVMVLGSGDENETDLVQVGVNGVTQFFRRDVAQVVKRKFVARLARSKRTDYRQTLDDRLGEAMNTMNPRHALKYPFTVIEDKNPKGAAWIKAVLAERQ